MADHSSIDESGIALDALRVTNELMPIAAQIRNDADEALETKAATARAAWAASNELRSAQAAGHHAVALRARHLAEAAKIEDLFTKGLLGPEGRALKLQQLEELSEKEMGAHQQIIDAQVDVLTTTVAAPGFRSPMAERTRDAVLLKSTQFSWMSRGDVLREAVDAYRVATNPKASAEDATHANRLLAEFYLPALRRTSTAPEKHSKAYAAPAGALAEAFERHLDATTGRAQWDVAQDLAARFQSEFKALRQYYRQPGVDPFVLKLAAPTLLAELQP